MRRSRPPAVAFIGLAPVVFSVLLFAACAESARDDRGGSADPGTAGERDEAGAPVVAPGAGDAGAACGAQCSADLHSVVDCDDHVVSRCRDDQGCSPSGCVAACDAANATKSSVGCEYYAVEPDVYATKRGACYAAFVANTWTTPVKLAVERDGSALDAAGFARIPRGTGASITYEPLPNGEIPPGEVAVVFLSHDPSSSIACPAGITPAVVGDAAVHATGRGHAFHLSASAPVVAYDIFPYGGGNAAVTSATLLLPTSAWDTNYVAVNAYRKSIVAGDPTLAIVARDDDTHVSLSPGVEIIDGDGVTATPPNTVGTYTLARGEILQFTQAQELTGTPIQSDKPVAVWGGATCMTIDLPMQACDGAHQQIPPVRALGHEYVAVRHKNRIPSRDEFPPWRVVGAVDGTTLSYEPRTPSVEAPATLGAGQVKEMTTSDVFVVKSQDAAHPFYLSGHMNGCQYIGGFESEVGCAGDPEFVNVIPTDQFLPSYVFFTDPTYPETNLVVVRAPRGRDGKLADVVLDCTGPITGWKPVGKYEYARVDLVTGNFEKHGSCDNGRHEIKSDAPFGLTVWGWGSKATRPAFFSEAVSYAYPAGAGVRALSTVVVPAKPK